MPRPTGLQKRALDVPLQVGLSEKLAPEMAPPEGMYQLDNVELDKLGVVTRRRGFEIMTSAALGPGAAGSFGIPKKVAGRAQELFAVSEDAGYLGSGGGAGNAGSILWSYSPESVAWRAHSKVPNCTLERDFGISNGQINATKSVGSAFVSSSGSHRYVVTTYVQGSWNSSNTGIRAMVCDETSKTMILEDSVIVSTANIADMQIIAVGRYAVIVFRERQSLPSVAAAVRCYVYDSQNPGNGFSAEFNLTNPANTNGGRGWTITTDTATLFLLEIDNARNVTAHRFTVGFSGLTEIGTVVMHTNGDTCEPGASIAGGFFHASWKDNPTQGPFYGKANQSLLSVISTLDVSADTLSNFRKVYNVAIDANNVVVFWDVFETPPTGSSHVAWRWVDATVAGAAVNRANTHRQPGVIMLTHPFVKNSRVYIGLTGCYAGPDSVEGAYNGSSASNLGHVLCEIPSSPTQEDSATGNPFVTMMPVALWSRDVSINFGGACFASPGDDGDVFITSIREARKSDSIFRDSSQQLYPVVHTTSVWAFDVIRIAFAHPKRWQHAELDNQTVLACALPYVYDGERAHECGYVFRPGFTIIEQPDAVGSGVWNPDDVLFYRTVYEWEDFSGRRWFSDSSYPYEVTILAVTASPTSGRDPQVTPRAPWLTMKPDGAHSFSGRVRVNTYRALSSSPTEYKLIDVQVHMIWSAGGTRETGYMAPFTDAGQDLSSAEDIYTFGGELDNSVAPACFSLAQHRDRLFAISSEDNSLYYTKPFRPGRGIEWSRFQNKALPQRGMALASVEGSLLVFTDKSILVLDGPGPSPTGVPPDAFARFAVLSQDQGCSELCAAWRCPRGVVFRSHQGLWLVTPQLAVLYVGAPVEDVVKTVDYFVDAALDERLGCLRLLGYTGGDYVSLVYWYDSDRWSKDTYSLPKAGTQYSSLALHGEYYMASSVGVRKRNDTAWQDGVEVVGSGDATYRVSLRSSWLRFDSMVSFKRLWRFLLTLRHQGASEDQWGVRITVETDSRSSSFDFYPEDFARGLSHFDGTLRVHLKYQKGQRFRITVSELQGAGLAAYNPGYSFTSMGFELGMKRGAAKMGQERSPST